MKTLAAVWAAALVCGCVFVYLLGAAEEVVGTVAHATATVVLDRG